MWKGQNDYECKATPSGNCRKTGSGAYQAEAVGNNTKGRLSATDAACQATFSAGCLGTDAGKTQVAFDVGTDRKRWNAQNNKTCADVGSANCRNANLYAGVTIDNVNARESSSSALCKDKSNAGSANTKCIKQSVSAGKYWTVFDANPLYQVWNASGNQSCVALTATQCRVSGTRLADAKSATQAMTSNTNSVCSTATNLGCINTTGANFYEALGKNGWTASGNRDCLAVAAATNCRASSKLTQAFGNTKTGWLSTNDAACTVAADNGNNCRNANKIIETLVSNNSAWTAADDYTCKAIADANCGSSKLSVTFASLATSNDATIPNKKGKNATGYACETVPTSQCKNATNKGINENFGTKAWTSTNDYRCAALSATTCRKTSSPYDPIAFASALKTGWTSSSNGACVTAPNTDCRNATTGANEALGKKAWTSADS